MSQYNKQEFISSELSLEKVLGFPIAKGIPSRGITEETCRRFGVREEYSRTEGTVLAYLFPVYSKGEIKGFKRRVKDGTKRKKESFSSVGDVTEDSELFGQSTSGTGIKLWITEGEYDCLALYQCLWERRGRVHNLHPAVTSIVLGAGNAAANVAANTAYLNRFKEVTLVYDSDEQGQSAVRETALIYPRLKNCLLGHKDAHEYLKASQEEELIDAVMTPVEYNVEQLHFGGLPTEILMTAITKGVMVDAFPALMQRLKGFRGGELTIISAPPKSGKSSLCRMLNYEFLRQKIPTLGVYLEDDIVKTVQAFVAIDNNVHLPTYRENPSILSPSQVDRTNAILLNPAWATFCDDRKGHITPKRLMDTFEWAALKGVKMMVLDHISFVFSGMKSKDERKEIDKLLTDMATFVKRTQTHIIAVTHIVVDRNRNKPHNADGSIKYPYWYEIEDTDARGSGAFAQVCWNMIGIDKEITEDKSRGQTRLSLLLNREWDRTGACDILTVDQYTGRLQAVL